MMTATGVSFADCTEKAELVERYKSALASYGSRPRAKAPPPQTSKPTPPRATASAPPRASASRAPPPPKKLSIDEMGRTPDGKDGGEIGKEVRRVVACKDYYEILKVERSCKEEELKKAYRKIALRLHPDKCQLSGAEDAFKKVSVAFSCLNDAKTRSGYDIGGEEAVSRPGGGGAGFRGDVDAEELFRAFCGAGRGGFKMENLTNAVQKNPWILLVGLTMLSNVVYMLEALLSNPILLMIPFVLFMMCPAHYRTHARTIFTRLLMQC